MATEREMKTIYCDNYFDLLEIQHSLPENIHKNTLLVVGRQIEKAKARLTKEEAAAVLERFNAYKSLLI